MTSAPRKLAFSTRALMVFTIYCGIALAELRVSDWRHALLAPIACWIAVSLMGQARDIWTTIRGWTDVPVDELNGWRFAVGWRAATAVLIVLSIGAHILAKAEIIPRTSAEGYYGMWPETALYTLIQTLLLIVVCSASRPRALPRRRVFWNAIVTCGGFAAGATMAWIIWHDQSIMPALVYISIRGIEDSNPLWLAPNAVGLAAVATEIRFITISTWAIVVAAANVVLLWLFGRVRSHRSRTIVGLALTSGLAGGLAFLVWLALEGLDSLTPHIPRPYSAHSPATWVSIGLLVLFASGAYAVRVARRQPRHVLPNRFVSRFNSFDYSHESARFLCVFAAVTFIVLAADFYLEWVNWWGGSTWLTIIGEYLHYGREFLITLALFLAALSAWASCWRARRDASVRTSSPLHLPNFAFTWAATFLTLVLTAVAVGAFSFSTRIAPWWRLGWNY